MAFPDPTPAARKTPREHTEFLSALASAIAASGRGQPAALMHLEVSRAADIRAACGEGGLLALEDLIQAVIQNQLGPQVPALAIGAGRVALLVHQVLPADALIRARRLRGALDRGRFSWHGHPFRLGAHLGVVELGPEPGACEAWMALARRACEAARELGGSGIQLMALAGDAWRELDREQEWRRHLSEVI